MPTNRTTINIWRDKHDPLEDHNSSLYHTAMEIIFGVDIMSETGVCICSEDIPPEVMDLMNDMDIPPESWVLIG